MLKFSGAILKFFYHIKPVVVKLIPIKWLRSVKRHLVLSSSSGVGSATPQPFERGSFPDGINLIGSICGESGLGQSCRLVAYALDNSSINYTITDYKPLSTLRSQDHSWDEKITGTQPYNVNLIHINPHDLAVAWFQLDRKIWDKRYNIGFWLWEMENFPREWLPALSLLDEIWTPSDFAGMGLKKITDKPVFTIPYSIEATTDSAYTRSFFKLPDSQFLFLTMYDCNSTMERKNPLGAIRAYKTAFPQENPNVGLVVKVNNPQAEDLELLRHELAKYTNIYFVAEILNKVQVNSLISCVDVLVSLHRAEGFGLPLAEAMLLGTPTIATNWSSNTEFQTTDTACLVDYSFAVIEKDIGPYKTGNRWADPDIVEAASAMCRLYEDKGFYQNISQNGQAYIKEKLSLEQAVRHIANRISEIYSDNVLD